MLLISIALLFNQEDESYHSLVFLIQKLQHERISLVTVTDKTHAEIADWQKSLSLDEPVVVEHGSAVLIPSNSDRYFPTETELDSKYRVK